MNILVTGAHRTGTTWVGQMLAAGGLAYVSEPLNVLRRRGVMSAPVKHWYTYISRENESDYLSAFQNTLALRYQFLAEVKSLRSRRDILRMGRDLGIFVRGRALRQPALLKDPFAVFSIPWFVERLNCRAVVTLRHPAAFASSLKRLNWPFDFHDLLNQPLLMRDHLEADRADMQRIQPDDIIGQSALLWRIIYRVVQRTVERIPSIILVRHEDLSLNPVNGFAKAYESLGLAYPLKVQETIRNSSSSENPVELSRQKTHSVKLDSRANLDSWKKRLSAEEIARIRAITEEVASFYYPENSW